MLLHIHFATGGVPFSIRRIHTHHEGRLRSYIVLMQRTERDLTRERRNQSYIVKMRNITKLRLSIKHSYDYDSFSLGRVPLGGTAANGYTFFSGNGLTKILQPNWSDGMSFHWPICVISTPQGFNFLLSGTTSALFFPLLSAIVPSPLFAFHYNIL